VSGMSQYVAVLGPRFPVGRPSARSSVARRDESDTLLARFDAPSLGKAYVEIRRVCREGGSVALADGAVTLPPGLLRLSRVYRARLPELYQLTSRHHASQVLARADANRVYVVPWALSPWSVIRALTPPTLFPTRTSHEPRLTRVA
jgi:hypothetical protein